MGTTKRCPRKTVTIVTKADTVAVCLVHKVTKVILDQWIRTQTVKIHTNTKIKTNELR